MSRRTLTPTLKRIKKELRDFAGNAQGLPHAVYHTFLQPKSRKLVKLYTVHIQDKAVANAAVDWLLEQGAIQAKTSALGTWHNVSAVFSDDL